MSGEPRSHDQAYLRPSWYWGFDEAPPARKGRNRPARLTGAYLSWARPTASAKDAGNGDGRCKRASPARDIRGRLGDRVSRPQAAGAAGRLAPGTGRRWREQKKKKKKHKFHRGGPMAAGGRSPGNIGVSAAITRGCVSGQTASPGGKRTSRACRPAQSDHPASCGHGRYWAICSHAVVPRLIPPSGQSR